MPEEPFDLEANNAFREKQRQAYLSDRDKTVSGNRFGGLFNTLYDDPFATARITAGRAGEAAGIAGDIFGGIFGEGGTDFGGIAEGLLSNLQGVSQQERDVAYQGIDDEAGRALGNVSNRLSQFGNVDPEQFSRIAGDIDVGRVRARGEADARFAGMDRQTDLSVLRTLPSFMQAQQSQRKEFGDLTNTILNAAPIRGVDIDNAAQGIY